MARKTHSVVSTARFRWEALLQPRIRAIADLLGDREVQTHDGEVGELTGYNRDQIRYTRETMMAMGILEWNHPASDPRAPAYWRMTVTDRGQLEVVLSTELERQMRGGLTYGAIKEKERAARKRPPTRQSAEKVAVQTDRLGFAERAVAGPEAPNVLAPLRGMGPDAPGALVMAAKQYRGGEGPEQRKAAKLVADLNEIGVSVPPELAAKARPQKDDRLEAIRLVLPYIEDLERRLVAANDQLRSMSDYGKLKEINRRQHEQIERLVAQRTADAMGATPHRG